MSPRSWRRTASRGTHAAAANDEVCRCGASPVDVRSLPELEHEQAPEAVAVVGSAGRRGRRAGVRRRVGRSWPRRARAIVEQDVAREVSQLAAEPAPRAARRSPSCRAPTPRCGRSAANARRRASFPRRPFAFRRVGQRDAELEHVPVEERRAELERMRHRSEVRLQRAGRRAGTSGRRAAGGRRSPAAAAGRAAASVGAGRATKAGSSQPRAELCGKHLHQAAVALWPGAAAAASSRRAARVVVERGSLAECRRSARAATPVPGTGARCPASP